MVEGEFYRSSVAQLILVALWTGIRETAGSNPVIHHPDVFHDLP